MENNAALAHVRLNSPVSRWVQPRLLRKAVDYAPVCKASVDRAVNDPQGLKERTAPVWIAEEFCYIVQFAACQQSPYPAVVGAISATDDETCRNEALGTSTAATSKASASRVLLPTFYCFGCNSSALDLPILVTLLRALVINQWCSTMTTSL